MNVSLPPSLKQWVKRQADLGGYDSASDFIYDLLRQARGKHVQKRIDSLLLEAIESGASIEMNDEDLDEIRDTARSQAKRARRGKVR